MEFNLDSPVLSGAKAYMKESSMFKSYRPYVFTTPRHETLGARESATLGVYLTSMGRIDVYGPDAVSMLNAVCVNRDFSKLKVGGSRHGLMVDAQGREISSGVITRLEEDRFKTYCMFGLIGYAMSGQWNVKLDFFDEFIYQVDGPKSLQILEKAFQCDLHDLKFARNKTVNVDGCELLVHRLGMSGALAYEMHGAPEFADMIYEKILEAGKEFDIRRQGLAQYCAYTHTPGGYPNALVHYDIPQMSADMPAPLHTGSCVDNPEDYYVNPYMVNWGYLVNFDHEFVGKEALQRLETEETRTAATLVWNLEDVGKVYAAQIADPSLAEPEGIEEFADWLPETRRIHCDKVLADGRQIGMTSGRCIDYYTNTFVSMGFIEKEYAVEGTKVEVVWGMPGTNQMKIRATVATFPYYDGEYRNETCDVSNIPRLFPEE